MDAQIAPTSSNPDILFTKMSGPQNVPAPGGEAGFNDLDAELVVEVAEAQQLRPATLVADQRVDADVGAHRVELRPERRAAADLLPASRNR